MEKPFVCACAKHSIDPPCEDPCTVFEYQREATESASPNTDDD